MNFRKVLISNRNTLQRYKKEIFDLFQKSFDKPIDELLWHWAYLNNPNGDPIVSLYFDEDILAGHYAIIPISLNHMKIGKIKAALSMTTMVDIPYRRNGIFVDQANEVYEEAIKLGYKLVYGFPNKNSAPGFKKRLGWTLEDNLYIAKFTYHELDNLNKQNYTNAIHFNHQDDKNLKWRLEKPNQKYISTEGGIIKKHGIDYDIILNNGDLSTLERDVQYNLYLDHDLDKHIEKKQFDYSFGYRVFDNSLDNIAFKKDMIMSDVF